MARMRLIAGCKPTARPSKKRSSNAGNAFPDIKQPKAKGKMVRSFVEPQAIPAIDSMSTGATTLHMYPGVDPIRKPLPIEECTTEKGVPLPGYWVGTTYGRKNDERHIRKPDGTNPTKRTVRIGLPLDDEV